MMRQPFACVKITVNIVKSVLNKNKEIITFSTKKLTKSSLLKNLCFFQKKIENSGYVQIPF
jgi:hypothetical protein